MICENLRFSEQTVVKGYIENRRLSHSVGLSEMNNENRTSQFRIFPVCRSVTFFADQLHTPHSKLHTAIVRRSRTGS